MEHIRVIRVGIVGAVENERNVKRIQIRRIARGQLLFRIRNIIQAVLYEVFRRLANLRAHARRAVQKRVDHILVRNAAGARNSAVRKRLGKCVRVFGQQRREVFLCRLPDFLRVGWRIVPRIERAVGVVRIGSASCKLRHLGAHLYELQIHIRRRVNIQLFLRAQSRVLAHKLRLLRTEVHAFLRGLLIVAFENLNLPRLKFPAQKPRMFSLGYLVQRLMIQIRRIVIGLRLPQRTLGKRLIRRVPVALQRQKRGRRVDFHQHLLGLEASPVERLLAVFLRGSRDGLAVGRVSLAGDLSELHFIIGALVPRQRLKIAVTRQRLDLFFRFCLCLLLRRLRFLPQLVQCVLHNRNRQAPAKTQQNAHAEHQRQYSCS